ncbi:MAG: GIY-YIG nuclease family protein [Candidatus Roizmanbacteria bacterium]|nr:MAG: GIY-YIG nuclease family protein [Candidatus Roizmanbacteria bacterium]
MFYVYILTAKDNQTFIGCTDDLRYTIKKHFLGFVRETKNQMPLKLLAYFAFLNEQTAYNFEKYLKSSSGRIFMKKNAFI